MCDHLVPSVIRMQRIDGINRGLGRNGKRDAGIMIQAEMRHSAFHCLYLTAHPSITATKVPGLWI